MNDPMGRILVPTDGSEESDAAYAAIMPLVRAYAPEVAVLHVFEDPEASFVPPARIAKACRALRSVHVNAHLELRVGTPADQILEVARGRKADLIAISTHGRAGVGRLLWGSVAEAVLRRAELPVLVTRPGSHERPWKKIVVALDGSERGEAILPDAVRVAKKLGAALDLVRVAVPVPPLLGIGDVPTPLLPADDPLPYLKTVVERVSHEGVEARAVGLEGGVRTRILQHVQESGAGLLCLTTHGRTGLARVLLGSTAEDLLRHAPCPVLLRRSADAEPPPKSDPNPRADIP